MYHHYTLQTIFHLCIPKKDLAKPHFYNQINISKTELQCSVWNFDILERVTAVSIGNNIFPNEFKILVEIHISRLILQRSKLYIFDLKKEVNLLENHTSFPMV